MKLKKILANLDGLDAAIAALYEQKADGKFHLDVEDEDTGALLRAKEHEQGLRKLADQTAATATADLTAAQTRIAELERAQSATTVELRADHERAVAALTEKFTKERAALEGSVKKIYVGDVANRIATEIAVDEGAAELLGDRLRSRLVVEMVNGEPVTRVLAADGTASNMSPDDLKAEYLSNQKYAAILRASDASGGGASGGGSKGGGAAGKKLADLGDAERNKIRTENPAEWTRLVDEARNAG